MFSLWNLPRLPSSPLPVPSLSEAGSALLGHPASFTEPLSTARQVSYHDAGVGLVVVGGVHTLEPLLACRVPKVHKDCLAIHCGCVLVQGQGVRGQLLWLTAFRLRNRDEQKAGKEGAWGGGTGR